MFGSALVAPVRQQLRCISSKKVRFRFLSMSLCQFHAAKLRWCRKNSMKSLAKSYPILSLNMYWQGQKVHLWSADSFSSTASPILPCPPFKVESMSRVFRAMGDFMGVLGVLGEIGVFGDSTSSSSGAESSGPQAEAGTVAWGERWIKKEICQSDSILFNIIYWQIV